MIGDDIFFVTCNVVVFGNQPHTSLWIRIVVVLSLSYLCFSDIKCWEEYQMHCTVAPSFSHAQCVCLRHNVYIVIPTTLLGAVVLLLTRETISYPKIFWFLFTILKNDFNLRTTFDNTYCFKGIISETKLILEFTLGGSGDSIIRIFGIRN